MILYGFFKYPSYLSLSTVFPFHPSPKLFPLFFTVSPSYPHALCYFSLSRDPSHPSTTTVLSYLLFWFLLLLEVIYTFIKIQSWEQQIREHEALGFLGLFTSLIIFLYCRIQVLGQWKNIHRIFPQGREICHTKQCYIVTFYLFILIITEELRDMILLPFIFYFGYNSFPFLTMIYKHVMLVFFCNADLRSLDIKVINKYFKVFKTFESFTWPHMVLHLRYLMKIGIQ